MIRTASKYLATLTLVLVACGGGEKTTAPAPVKDPNIVGATGGTINASGGAVQLTIPAGALTSDVKITVTPKSDVAGDTRALAGTAYEFGPEGTKFAQPVTLALKYDKSKLPAGAAQSELRVAQLTDDGQWVPVMQSLVIDSTTGMVKVAVTQLGGAPSSALRAALMESPVPATGGTKSWTSWKPAWTVYYPPLSPCTPVALGTGGAYSGQLVAGDCVQNSNNARRTDFYTVTTTTQSVLLLNVSGGITGPFGVQASGLAAYASATVGGDTVATLVPAGTWMIFVTGADSTVRGNYTISASTVPLSSRSGCAWLYLVPGQSLDGHIVSAAGSPSCSAVIPQTEPNAAHRGKTTYFDYYAVRLFKDKTYTISVSPKGAGNPCPALWQGGRLVTPWIATGAFPRTITVTPPADLYYGIEVESCSTSTSTWSPATPMDYTLTITG